MSCVFACVHIRLRVLAEVVIAWRYGLDVKLARPVPRESENSTGVTALSCCPALLFTRLFPSHSSAGPHNDASRLHVGGEYLLPHHSLQHRARVRGHSGAGSGPCLVSYVLYAGGLTSLFATVYSFSQLESSKVLPTLFIDTGLLGLMVLW